MFGNDLTLSETIDDDLYWACHSGSNADRLNELIRKGGDVNASVGKNQTKTCLQAAVSGGHLHTVQALLNNGADVNIRAKGGQNSPTPLHTACRHGMLEMAQLLFTRCPMCEHDQEGVGHIRACRDAGRSNQRMSRRRRDTR